MKAWAVQLFDRDGYYATVVEATRVDVCAVVDARTLRAVSCIACTMPYAIECEPGRAPDASLPELFREELRGLDLKGDSP
jgi:hypothetical protein